ncbi:AMIN domain-containing protein [Limimaricola cinnabarinus]|uniref:AMIN domain-containing protein n=1 Tax=Limimaricola cinnabarinus TaxID=1125964 RepID=UPI003F6F2526
MRRARAARGGEWVRRLLGGAGLALMLATSPAAQEFSGLARLDPSESRVADTRRGLEIELALSQPVPWRVFTLDGPRRLVIDFAQVDWSGAEAAALLSGERATALRLGRGRPGWSRLVLDLSEPLGLLSAEMRSAASGAARLHAVLAPVTAEAFAAAAKPADPAGETLAAPQTSITADGPLVVAIDPGHGGVDPGACARGWSRPS